MFASDSLGGKWKAVSLKASTADKNSFLCQAGWSLWLQQQPAQKMISITSACRKTSPPPSDSNHTLCEARISPCEASRDCVQTSDCSPRRASRGHSVHFSPSQPRPPACLVKYMFRNLSHRHLEGPLEINCFNPLGLQKRVQTFPGSQSTDKNPCPGMGFPSFWGLVPLPQAAFVNKPTPCPIVQCKA